MSVKLDRHIGYGTQTFLFGRKSGLYGDVKMIIEKKDDNTETVTLEGVQYKYFEKSFLENHNLGDNPDGYICFTYNSSSGDVDVVSNNTEYFVDDSDLSTAFSAIGSKDSSVITLNQVEVVRAVAYITGTVDSEKLGYDSTDAYNYSKKKDYKYVYTVYDDTGSFLHGDAHLIKLAGIATT
jgi:hypothetical protein